MGRTVTIVGASAAAEELLLEVFDFILSEAILPSQFLGFLLDVPGGVAIAVCVRMSKRR